MLHRKTDLCLPHFNHILQNHKTTQISGSVSHVCILQASRNCHLKNQIQCNSTTKSQNGRTVDRGHFEQQVKQAGDVNRILIVKGWILSDADGQPECRPEWREHRAGSIYQAYDASVIFRNPPACTPSTPTHR